MSENIAKYNVILELITEQKKSNETIEGIKRQTSGLQSLFKTAGLAFAGMFSAQAISGINSKIFDITKKYQQYATILKVATGSEQEAEKSMKLIEDTAKGTTFSVDELTSSYIKMINRGIKPTKDEILAIADLAASQGKSFDQLTEAILDATTGEWERLKEFGIKATSEGDKVNLSFKGVNKTIEKTPEAIKKAIIEMGKMKGVSGSNAQQMNTLNGILSNMGDNAEKIWKNIGERLKKFYTENLSGVAKMVEWLSKITEIPIEEKLQNEQYELNALVLSITDVNTSQEKRSKLMTELNEKYPFFLKYIGDENASNDKLTIGLKEINGLYVKRLLLIGYQKDIEELLQKQADLERDKFDKDLERRKQLSKINIELKLGVDLAKIGDINKQGEAIQKALLKLISTPGAKNKSQAQWYLEAFDKDWFNSLGKTRTKRIEETKIEIEQTQKDFQDLEKNLGISLENINKIFDAGGDTSKPTTPTPTTTTQKGIDKKHKAELDLIEKQYLEKKILVNRLAEDERKDRERTITDKVLLEKQEIQSSKELSIALQEIELNKNIALAEKRKTQVSKNSKEYSELTLQIIEYKNNLEQLYSETGNFYESIIRTESQIGKESPTLPLTGNAKAKDELSDLKEQYSIILETLRSINELNKQGLLDFKIGTEAQKIIDIILNPEETKSKVDKSREKDLEDVTSRMLKTVKTPPEKDKRNFWEKLLGMDEDTKQDLISSLRDLKDEILDLYDIEIDKIDQLIDKQQERVDKAEQLAEKGKVKQLQIEEERLRELQEKREKYAKQQQALESVQIVSAQSLAAAQAIQGLVSSFKSGGPAGIATGVAWLLALGASILSIKNAVSSSFADIPTNIEGTELVQSDPRYRNKKVRTGQDGYLARFDGKERIVEPQVNKELGNFPNKLLPQAVQAYKLIPTVVKELRHQVNTTKDNDLKIERLEKKLDEVKKSIESIKIITKFDKNGFMQQIERDFDEVRRRKIIKG